MDAVGFSQQSQQNMFAVISAVLLLGNIQYVRVRKTLYLKGQNEVLEYLHLSDFEGNLTSVISVQFRGVVITATRMSLSAMKRC